MKPLIGKRPHPEMRENRINSPDNPTGAQRAAIARLTTKYGLKEKPNA